MRTGQLGTQAASDCLVGGGEMGALMRSMDWARSPLGPVESWPQSLRTSVSICLSSRFPIFVWWGPELVMLYNDAYRPMLGATKHPRAMGRPGRESWSEVWEILGPMAERVWQGEATWSDDQLLLADRNGFLEECYFTFSYSPIRDESGSVGGIFCAVTETSRRVLGERRLQTLRSLAEQATQAKTAEEACTLSARTLESNPHDLPFALFYLLDGDARQARLADTINLAAGTSASPGTVKIDSEDDVWSFRKVLETGKSELVEDLDPRFGPLPAGPWTDDQARCALVLPLAKAGAQELPAGFLVAGVSPRLAFDDDYRGFLDLAAGQIATAIANARAYEEERKRAEALAELDRAKTAFFSNVSHEFRTPLTLMLGPLEDVLQNGGDALPPAEREKIVVAHRNSLRLLKLVNTLLDFSRIEAGRFQASYEPTDLAAFTADLASVFRSTVERAGLRFDVSCPPLAEPVYVDREMWEKIVSNLLSNAFKFTFEGGIEVALRQAGEKVELVVKDTGTGIPEDEIPHLFERFRRVKGARGRAFEGSGIGLALVQELVKLHGGGVRVESEVDRGTTFTVSIPTGKAHLPADRIGAARSLEATGLGAEVYVEEALRWLPAETDQKEKRAKAPLSSERILLADDNADMLDYVRRLLSDRYEVEAVGDGLAALEAARERAPDLVLADVMMPGLDGFSLLAELRADAQLRTIPVILLSARAGEEARVEGMEAGADDYLVKPFSAKELLARVGAHLEMSRVRREATRRERELRAEAQGAKERLEGVLASINDQFLSLDHQWRYVFVNHRVIEVTGRRKEELLGKRLWDLYPDLLGTEFESSVRRAAAERAPVHFEYFYSKWNRWFENHVYPSESGVTLFVAEITERKQAEEALRASDRRKDEFLAMLGHELRNPLAPIRNAAHVLKLVGPSDVKQQWAREVIERQSQHLTRLVDDLLDVSRITQGKVTLQREPLDLSTIVHRAVETSRPLIDARKHHLSVTLPSEPVRVEGDLTRLVQIVGNLLNNAAKYTDEGGEIRLEATQEGTQAVLRVRDNGMGLPADLLPHVFDLFTQADRSLDRSQGGLGIGLTLVRQLVELHGGRVEAKSAGPGRGSEFIVRLPALSPITPASAKGASGEIDRPSSQGLKVLVVEDNVDSAEMLSFLLKLGGHETRTAHDGPAALEAARLFQPQVILCDIGLPGMNGYEVAQKLRAQPELQHARLIALTGYGQEEDRRRAQAAGFDYHLTKPVEPDALAALLVSLRADAPAR